MGSCPPSEPMKVKLTRLSDKTASTFGKSNSFEKLMTENLQLKSLLREQLLNLNASLTATRTSELLCASTFGHVCAPGFSTSSPASLFCAAPDVNKKHQCQGVSAWLHRQAPCSSDSCMDVSDSSSTEAPTTDDESEVGVEHGDEDGSNSGIMQRPLTVYMRNIPNRYSREKLLALFDLHGFKNQYRLVYLPMDFVTKVAKGYAFVCFGVHEEATRFMETFHGYRDWDFAGSTKVCEVVWSQEEQTVEEHVHRYRNCSLMHTSTPDVFRPALFADGVRVPFPLPTQPLLKPRGPWSSRHSKR